jgi:methionine-rich copper-binding protein CopC
VVRGESLKPTKEIKGSTYYVDVTLEFLQDVDDCMPGVVLRNQAGVRVTASNTEWIGVTLPTFKKGQKKTVRFTFTNALEHGLYFVSSNVVSSKTKQFYDWSNDAAHFQVTGKPVTGGVANPEYKVEVV